MSIGKKFLLVGILAFIIISFGNTYSYKSQHNIANNINVLVKNSLNKDVTQSLKNDAYAFQDNMEELLQLYLKGLNYSNTKQNIEAYYEKISQNMKSLKNDLGNSTNDKNIVDDFNLVYQELEDMLAFYKKELQDESNINSMTKAGQVLGQIKKYGEDLNLHLSKFSASIDENHQSNTKDLLDNINQTKSTQIWVIAITTIFIIPLFSYLFINVLGNLRKSVQDIINLADGNLNIDITPVKSQDETGKLSMASIKLKKSLADVYKLNNAVEALPMGIVLIDIYNDFSIEYTNKFFNIFCKNKEHCFNVKTSEYNKGIKIYTIFPDTKTCLEKYLHSDKSIHKLSIKYDNDLFEFTFYPVMDSSGKIITVLLSINDISYLDKLANTFEESVNMAITDLSNIVRQVQTNASKVTDIVEQTQVQSTSVAKSTTQAAQNVSSVASATEELSASIREISTRLVQSKNIANKAVQEADNSNKIITELAEKAEKIGQVIDIIMTIAEQINLLSLNATIESARAGEAGKGFAVVANEVKALANQTAKASEEIADQIKDVQSSTSKVVNTITTMTEVVNNMREISTSIATAVEEQSSATSEISQNVQKTAMSTSEISQSINLVKEGADETGKSTQEFIQSSNVIEEKINMLKLKSNEFLDHIRGKEAL